MSILLVLFLFYLLNSTSALWPFDEILKNDTPSPRVNEHNEDNSNKMVQFEIATAEQKFLQEAKQLLNLSPLDTCQHKVVDSLRQSCGKLSEEDIGKLSVQLLNCQSNSEGRETYPCTSDMSIAECTGSMDAHMWNAYHIISNRARSVCYSIRQTQFRVQAETAVNRLSQTTAYQLRAMEELSNSQDEIRQSTLESLDALKREKDELVKRQSDLDAYQDNIKTAMEANIDQLNHERALLFSGHTLIHNITHSIQQQLESAQRMLKDQEANQEKHYNDLSSELNRMRGNIKEVWSNIDNSTVKLMMVVNQLNLQYDDLQTRLNTINHTVSNVLLLLDNMNHAINVQLGWIMESFGGAQDGLYLLTAIASHGVFLLISSLVLLFLKAPWFSRLMLLVMVVGNLIMAINFPYCLTMMQLALLLGIVFIGDVLFLSTIYYRHRFSSNPIPLTTPIAPPYTPSTAGSTNSSRRTIDISDDEVDDLITDINQNGGFIPNSDQPPLYSAIPPHIEDFDKCHGLNRRGLPCRLKASPGSPYCFRHK